MALLARPRPDRASRIQHHPCCGTGTLRVSPTTNTAILRHISHQLLQLANHNKASSPCDFIKSIIPIITPNAYSPLIVMAVSFLHEGLTELVRKQPEFTKSLLTKCLGMGVPPSSSARLSESTLNEPVPAEYHADAAILLGADDAPTFGAIVETQLERRDRKRFTWPHYATGARARHECPFLVVVVAPDPAVARWAAEPIDLGFGSILGAALSRPVSTGGVSIT